MSDVSYFSQMFSQAQVADWVAEAGWEVVWPCPLALCEEWTCAPGLTEAVKSGSHGLDGDGVCLPGQFGSAVGECCCVTPQTNCSV